MKGARKCFNFIMSLKPSAQTFLIRREFNCPILRSIHIDNAESLKALAKLRDFRHVVNEPLTLHFKGETTYIHLAVEKKN